MRNNIIVSGICSHCHSQGCQYLSANILIKYWSIAENITKSRYHKYPKCISYLCMLFIIHVCKKYKSTKNMNVDYNKAWQKVDSVSKREILYTILLLHTSRGKYYRQSFQQSAVFLEYIHIPYSTTAMSQKSKFVKTIKWEVHLFHLDQKFAKPTLRHQIEKC